jgi:Mlc titration factor MtfA (ptsG expression regulator)
LSLRVGIAAEKVWGAMGWFRNRRRERLWREGLSSTEESIVLAGVWQVEYLSAADRQRLFRWVAVFADDKRWEGCGGFRLDRGCQLLVATQVGLMLLAKPNFYFDAVRSILVYPTPYIAPNQPRAIGSGMELRQDEARAGEAWYRGPVVLNWQDIVAGGLGTNDGQNLVMHEFTHQIDMLNGGRADGIPPLPEKVDVVAWQSEYEQLFASLVEQASFGGLSWGDGYLVSEPAELLAGASERFFQTPRRLAFECDQLFALLLECYGFDPSFWDQDGI